MCFAKSWLLVGIILASLLCFYLILSGKAWEVSPMIPIRGDPGGLLGNCRRGLGVHLRLFSRWRNPSLASGRGNAGSVVTPLPSNCCTRSLRPWGCFNLFPKFWDFHSSVLFIYIYIANAGPIVRGTNREHPVSPSWRLHSFFFFLLFFM